MTYSELQQLTHGKEIVSKLTGKPVTRTQLFFDSSDDEIENLLKGYESNYRLRDKEGWKDGEYQEKKDEPITLKNN